MNNTGLEMLRQLYLERKGSLNPGMKTDVDSCLWEIADWFVKNRRSITPSELEPILQKHCGAEAEVKKFVSFLETDPGQMRFKTLLRERKESPTPPWMGKSTKEQTQPIRESISAPFYTGGVKLPSQLDQLCEKFKDPLTETECQIISPQYYDVLGWLNIPVPDYSFAIEPEVKERKIDLVLQQLKDGVARIHESTVFREFLLTTAKFHHYSIGNLILIMLQKPGATRVAGIKTWNELGRYVKRGEKGIAILAPCLPPRILRCPLCEKTFTERDLRVHIEQLHPGADVSQLVRQAKEEMEAVVPTPTYFKVVYVFDVSQTEGKPLPEFVVPTVTEFYNEDLYQRLMKLAEKYGLSISLEPKPELDPGIKGSLQGKNIWVKPDELPAQRLKTLGHEEAHYFTENVYFIPRADAEVIAESVAFVVCAHFGFDSGVRSFPYVALWAKEKKVLEQNLASIRKISGRMIEELGG